VAFNRWAPSKKRQPVRGTFPVLGRLGSRLEAAKDCAQAADLGDGIVNGNAETGSNGNVQSEAVESRLSSHPPGRL